MTGFSDRSVFFQMSLKYPEASDRVVTVFTPSEAVMATLAIGSCFSVSVSWRITAPSIGINCAAMDFCRYARSNRRATTMAVTPTMIQVVFRPIVQNELDHKSWSIYEMPRARLGSIIQLFDKYHREFIPALPGRAE